MWCSLYRLTCFTFYAKRKLLDADLSVYQRFLGYLQEASVACVNLFGRLVRQASNLAPSCRAIVIRFEIFEIH